MMSLEPEEDSELRDLVAGTLQSSGILGHLKAQLRSNVYLALDGGPDRSKNQQGGVLNQPNPPLARFLKTSEGRLALNLFKEFLDFFKLSFTRSVLDPETEAGGSGASGLNRAELIEKLGLAPEVVNEEHPLLCEIIKLSKVQVLKSETPSPPTPRASLTRAFGSGGATTPTQSLTTPESSLLHHERISGGLPSPLEKTPSPLDKPTHLGDLPPLMGLGGPGPNQDVDFLSQILGKEPKPVEKKEPARVPEAKKLEPIPAKTTATATAQDEDEVEEDIEEEILEDFSLTDGDSRSEGFTKDESMLGDISDSKLGDYIEDCKR